PTNAFCRVSMSSFAASYDNTVGIAPPVRTAWAKDLVAPVLNIGT
ncbi:hypothetical protein A2U01_0063605, partial [Trifolium medium]|nr:hypothetical protein [Trifolium medium]